MNIGGDDKGFKKLRGKRKVVDAKKAEYVLAMVLGGRCKGVEERERAL